MTKRIFGGSSAFGLALALLCGGAHGMSPGTLNEGEHTMMAAGIDLIGQLPTGDFADAVGLGLGALGRFEYQINESAVGLTARAGYIHHLENDAGGVTTSYAQVPLLAGIKYSLTGAPIYIAAEAGAVIGMWDISSDFPPLDEGSSTETNFAWSAGVGYELGPVDVRLALYFPDATNMADMISIGASFGYNFWGR